MIYDATGRCHRAMSIKETDDIEVVVSGHVSTCTQEKFMHTKEDKVSQCTAHAVGHRQFSTHSNLINFSYIWKSAPENPLIKRYLMISWAHDYSAGNL